MPQIRNHVKAPTIVHRLLQLSQERTEKIAYTFLLDGETQEASITYGELDRQARLIAARLQSAGANHQRVLLLYPPGLDYISAFLGCLYAGAVAVPTYPPDVTRLDRSLPRFISIIKDADAKFVLTTSPILSMSQFLVLQNPELQELEWIGSDTIAQEPGIIDEWKNPDIRPDNLAFLQYTSGSTAEPKGVMLTHGNLIHQLEQIDQAFSLNHQRDSAVIWLPFYHDMGLIGGILGSLYHLGSTILMSPLDFLQRPFRWLSAISRSKATISGGPNFAYDLCVRKVTESQKETLDLSNWDLAFNGAEPVRMETLQRFATAFQSCGFRIENFYPCYGLAEATLLVTGSQRNKGPTFIRVRSDALENNRVVEGDDTLRDNISLVGCGYTYLEQEVIIVDPQTLLPCPVDENQTTSVGEIWVSGGSVAQGYWNKREESERIFHARLPGRDEHFLRTGDLGFLQQGQLFVTGRVKDLIIIDGLNHYPQDIELTTEKSHPALRPGCSAAFSIEVRGREELVVVVEVARLSQLKEIGAQQNIQINPESIKRAIIEAISAYHELRVYDLILLKPGTILKTSSGKIQRHACKLDYLNKSLDVWQA